LSQSFTPLISHQFFLAIVPLSFPTLRAAQLIDKHYYVLLHFMDMTLFLIIPHLLLHQLWWELGGISWICAFEMI